MPTLMIREDLTPDELRRLAKAERDLRVALCLLTIAAALDGLSREAAARMAGMDRQTLKGCTHCVQRHSVLSTRTVHEILMFRFPPLL
ncbi:hypothetical protein JMJ56_29825 [Belnapia sp. T18]|uniref:Uncharacterized protein n=1 Tax=Belnapia arida TaxID=2804533 RepID=A0ABS1UDZ3_9PROT|nr:hypothetical protein [Belnapia arida]